MNKLNEGKIFKILGGIFFIVLSLWLIHALFFGSANGFHMGIRGGYSGSHFDMGMRYGAGTAISFSVILMLLLKILFVLFIVALAVGIIIAVKRYLLTEEDIQHIKRTFTVREATTVKEVCSICGKEQNDDWKVCPYCGKEKEINN
jgi:hypothetical protein